MPVIQTSIFTVIERFPAHMDSILKYFFASQLIWLFGMIEIILFSNFNSNRSFLLELEEQFASRIDPVDLKPPYWEYWTRKNKYSIKR